MLLAALCCKLITSTDTFLSPASPLLSPLDGCLACQQFALHRQTSSHCSFLLCYVLCALVQCSFGQSWSTFLQSLGTSQVVCHLPPTPICQSPKLRSRLRSRRKKCGFDETQFLKSIPNSLTLTHIICILLLFDLRSEPGRYSEV